MLSARPRTAIAGGGARTLTFRAQTLALLALALLLGGSLRFYRLGAADLSADEAVSWAGATAPGMHAVVERQRLLDPGKLALYDVALRGWLRLGGDGVGWMRGFSAVLGTFSIVLIFAATRELILGFGGASEIPGVQCGAAVAALIAAVNLALVNQARMVRMYPLTLTLELLQVVCFLRAASPRARGLSRFASLAGIAVFGAFAIAANFTAALLIAAEAVWLGWAAFSRRIGARAGAASGFHLRGTAVALCAAVALLGPILPLAARNSIAVVRAGVLDWSHLRPPWWPLQMLRNASGKGPFLLLLPLAIYGVWRLRRGRAAASLGFVLCWMLAPQGIVMAISYAFTPFEQTRYVISSVAAFFILAGIGLAAIDSTKLRVVLLALLVAMSVDHVRRDFMRSRFVQWREATALALAANTPGGSIAVVPAYAVNVVRYYLLPARRASAEASDGRCEVRQRVMMLSGEELLTPAEIAALRSCDPILVGRLRLVEVRKR